MWIELSILLATAAFAIYRWVTANNDYFVKRQIPFDKPVFLMGSFVELLRRKKPLYDVVIDLYNKHDGKVYGIFDQRQPMLLVRDPELIKNIAIRDFDHFLNHRNTFRNDETEESHIFGSSLIFMRDGKWKDMRNTLSPAFTGSKLRSTFLLMNDVAQQACSYLIKQHKKSSAGEGVELDLKDFAKRFTTDIIATVAFGIQVNSFDDVDNEFYLMGKRITNFSFWTNIKFVLITNLRWLCKILKIDLFSKKVTDYYMDLVIKTMKYRKAHNILRPDMINMLMEARYSEASNKSSKYQWDDTEMAAQCLLFFFAGFESVSSLLSFAAYELMENPEVQERLFEEITEISENLEDGEQLTYEILQQKMPYLDMVISEVLRKWPPTLATDRVCTKDISYELDGGKKVELTPGDSLWFPIIALHMDSKYWSEPEKFIPERFSPENKEDIKPFTYIPFGVGPRNCIGSRLALLEAKAFLFHLVRQFRIERSSKMCNPFKISTKTFEFIPEGGFWLKLVPREK